MTPPRKVLNRAQHANALVHEGATIDSERLSGDERSVRREEERNCPCDILGLLQPAQRRVVDPRFTNRLRRPQFRLPLKLALLHRRVHVARANTVHENPVAGEFVGHRLR